MESSLITFRKFTNITLANQLAEILSDNQIQYSLENAAPAFDPRTMGSMATEYLLKINAYDFDKVNAILQDSETDNVDVVEENYYLFDFTNEELIDLISKPDEWNPFDVALGRKILGERGTTISDDQIKVMNQERLSELRKTEPSQSSWIIVGYIFALVGGVLGLFIGWHLSSHKKTLPNGERIFAYNEGDRKQGKIIFYLALAITIIWVALRILENAA